jgi:hypothetical protein
LANEGESSEDLSELESVHSEQQHYGASFPRSLNGNLNGDLNNESEKEDEMDAIFAFIDAYNPDTVPLDYRLQPFIPDYIPTIGDIDPIMQVITINFRSHLRIKSTHNLQNQFYLKKSS